jgi:DNA-binding response OmpR family regulator
MKLLLVEDEKHMAEALGQILKKNKYSVDLAFDGESGLDHGLSGVYDLIILDIMLPNLDGISILKELRKQGIPTPILMLTARGEINDKVIGLDSGADYYLAKPFASSELLAVLRALRRRQSDMINENELNYNNISLTLSDLCLHCEENKINLTLKEAQLLELLIKQKGITLSKETIINKLWGYDSDAYDNHAEVYVSFLRKKLNHVKASVSIRTVRGLGYILE